MKIVLLEDNHFHRENIEEWLSENFPTLEILVFETEFEFKKNIDRLIHSPPSLFIMDIMVRWATIDDYEDPPKEIEEKGHYRAGFRCKDAAKERKELKDVPIILLSVLGDDELKEHIKTLGKNEHFIEKNRFEKPLARRIKNVLRTGKLL